MLPTNGALVSYSVDIEFFQKNQKKKNLLEQYKYVNSCRPHCVLCTLKGCPVLSFRVFCSIPFIPRYPAWVVVLLLLHVSSLLAYVCVWQGSERACQSNGCDIPSIIIQAAATPQNFHRRTTDPPQLPSARCGLGWWRARPCRLPYLAWSGRAGRPNERKWW